MRKLILLIALIITACSQETKPVSLLSENKAVAEIIATPALPKNKLHKISLSALRGRLSQIKMLSVIG